MEDERRREKGKMIMTKEEEEEEEEELEEGEGETTGLEMLEIVVKSELSVIISDILGGVETGKKNVSEFSWENPKDYGIMIWEKGETSKKKKNPLPKPHNQRKTPLCIPYAITNLLNFQAGIISTYYKRSRLYVSLDYMVKVFSELKEKTITHFTDVLIEKQIYDVASFVKKANRPKVGATPKLSLSWDYGFSKDDYGDNEIGELILDAVRRFGGVLIERREIVLPNEGGVDILFPDLANVDRDLGHVVVCYGGKLVDGKYEFYCLDSAGGDVGSKFGYVTLRDLSSIHHVYVLQLNAWDASLNKKKTKNA